MKALRKTRPAPGAELVDMPIPAPGPQEVLLRVKAAAICGTDSHIYSWNDWAQQRIQPPMTLGHEVCGEIVQIGEGIGQEASGLRVGDLVAAETHIACSRCFQCQTGNAHVCEHMTILGVHTEGVFAEYAAIPASCAWKLPAGTDPELGVLLEPLGVAVHGLLVEPVEGKSVAVVGCGPIGILATQVTAALGAHPLFALDVNNDRLNLAKSIVRRAAVLNPASDDARWVVREATGGRGVDVAVELSGSASGTRLALDLARIGGRVSLVGLTDEPVTLSTCDDVIYKELTIKGITGRRIWQTWWQMQQLLLSRSFDPRDVITHRFPLAEYHAAFETAASGRAGKVLLLP